MTKIIVLLYLLSSIYAVYPPSLSEEAFVKYAAAAFSASYIEENTTENEDTNVIPLNVYTYALKNLGYLDKEENTLAGFRNGILHFQADQNILVDGTIGPVTIDKLNRKLSGACTVKHDILETETPEGYWIAINLSKRILTLYQDKEVLKKYPIAVGNPPSLSPTGKFTVANKVVNPAWGGGGYASPVSGGSEKNPLGFRWIGMSHMGGYVYGIHGNNNPSSIGTNASKGCIRLLNEDVEELFDIIRIGNEIWIGPDQVLREWGVMQNECDCA